MVKTKAIMKATVSAPEVTQKHQPPVAQHAVDGYARSLVQQGQRREDEDAGEQVEPHQVQHDETDREEHCSYQGRTGLNGDGDGKDCCQRKDGPAMKARIKVSRVDMKILNSPASTILVTNSKDE